MNEIKARRHWGTTVRQFAVYFTALCFTISCCMVLFLRNLQVENIIDSNRAALETAAKYTFLNVIGLSFLFTLVDTIWHHITVDRPVNKICAAAEKIMRGDLSVRIEKERFITPDEGYNLVIEYFNRMAEELGGIIGTLGLTLMAATFPISQAVIAKKREKIAPDVLRLTEELTGGDKF